SWNACEKLAIITYLEKNPIASKRHTAETFETVKYWFTSKYPLLEDELKTWIRSLCSAQKVVSQNMVRTKAKQLAKQSRFTSLYPTINKCKWSDKWLSSFMRRNRFSNRCRTTVAQKLPEELEPLRNEFLNY
ncbi:12544_t:CDS:2, partial [Cetraspora pellucida]